MFSIFIAKFRKIVEKFYIIWKHNKFRSRVLLPLIENNEIIGAELLAYFPFYELCYQNFSESHIVRIGRFKFKDNQS